MLTTAQVERFDKLDKDERSLLAIIEWSDDSIAAQLRKQPEWVREQIVRLIEKLEIGNYAPDEQRSWMGYQYGQYLAVVKTRPQPETAAVVAGAGKAGAAALASVKTPKSISADSAGRTTRRTRVSNKKSPEPDMRPLGPVEISTLVSIVKLLTGREREIAVMIAKGRTKKEIAEALSLNIGTVKVYVNTAMRRLHLHALTPRPVRHVLFRAAMLMSLGRTEEAADILKPIPELWIKPLSRAA